MKADIIIDLAYEDCGKGKISKFLSSTKKYTHCIRFNGGPNAGHTIYHHGKKFVTHQVPCGVFHGIKSIIGSGCVINIDELFKEIDQIQSGGINVNGLIKIAKNAHIITDKHLEEDGKDSKIGTTKRGIGPCYADKAFRTGIRAQDVDILKPFIVDLFDEINTEDAYVLCEGAQGFYLDIDWGDYPYVTSSPCTVAAAIQNGIPYNKINDVYGVVKAYETYVGAKSFEPDVEHFKKLREIGGEFGATTGRARQCNWIDIDKLKRAIQFNGVTKLIINKCDILEKLGMYAYIHNGEVKYFSSMELFKDFMVEELKHDIFSVNVIFSGNPEGL